MSSPGPDWVEQARRFVVSSGLGEALGGRPPGAAGGPSPDGLSSDHPAECRWCPVCVGMAALRGRRPDLVEGLADVLSTAAAVLRAHAAGGAAHAGGPAAGAPGKSADRSTPTPADVRQETVTPQPTPVQRIDVA